MDQDNSIEQSSDDRSHLFTVRLWREPMKSGRKEIRGKVQHVLSGEVQYFRGWVAMKAFMVEQIDVDGGDSGL